MSVDLFVYSPTRDIPTRKQLRTMLQDKGWKILYVSDWFNTTIAEDGRLSDDLVVGCRDAAGIEELRSCLSNGDREDAEAMLEQERFGNCALSIEAPCEIDDEQIAETEEEIGKEAADVMRQAQTTFSLTWKGRSTENSAYLAMDVWRTLGKLCGGLLDDPQTGDRFIVRVGEDPLAESGKLGGGP